MMLNTEGYLDARLLDDGRVIGVNQFIFTYGLMVDVDRISYERRYCYDDLWDALEAFREWDGAGHPPGPWIKMKGRYKGVAYDCGPDEAP
jgi:spermidine/putrescine-binding protein